MLFNPIKQVNLKCSPKQCGVLEITNKLCANKLGEHSSLWTSILHSLQMLLQLSLSNLQYTKMMKLYLQHCMWKKKMLVAVHTSTINTVHREPEILNNSTEIIKGFVCWMYQCLIKFLTKVHVYCLSEFSISHKALNKRY